MELKCRNGELKPETVWWKLYKVATIRETFSLTTGKRRTGVGRPQSSIGSHSMAATLPTEDQNTQVPGPRANENFHFIIKRKCCGIKVEVYA